MSEKQNSSQVNQKIRKAGFVAENSEKQERFLKMRKLNISRYFGEKSKNAWRFINTKLGKAREKLSKIDFKKMVSDGMLWLIEACLEGLVVNFALWGILEVRFTWVSFIAYGALIKEVLDIHKRIKDNGRNETIPKEH
jgi:hypothetical protein